MSVAVGGIGSMFGGVARVVLCVMTAFFSALALVGCGSSYAPSESPVKKLVGVWEGEYKAGQGETGLTLTVYEEGGYYKAIFDFYNLPGECNAASGKYYMNVSYGASSGGYYLTGYEWIVRPNNYGFANLQGILTTHDFSAKSYAEGELIDYDSTVSGGKITKDVFVGTLSGSTYQFGLVRVDKATQKPGTAVSAFSDSRDGKSYKAVKIGNQTWMTENLNYEIENSKCYANNPDNCAKYGRLYNWDDAMDACPAGWHLPSDAEWTTLTDYVCGESTAGRKLKSTNGYNNGNGTDDFGFSALPGGYGENGSFTHADYYGNWWSSTDDGNNAWYRYMGFDRESVTKSAETKARLKSVRCVQGQDTLQEHRREALRKLAGTWDGSYVAGQGETGLTLTVYEEEGKYKATFDFHNLPGKNNAANGKYYMNVSYNASTGRYSLNGYEWIVRPSNYGFANLDGTLTEDVFSGSLSGSNYKFKVAKIDPAKPKHDPAATAASEPASTAEAKSAAKIDQHIFGQWWNGEYSGGGSNCEAWDFNKDGTGSVTYDCSTTNFKFQIVNGKIKFSEVKGSEGGDEWEATWKDLEFSISDDGKTLILDKDKFTKGPGRCC